jgi:hypothetical protein
MPFFRRRARQRRRWRRRVVLLGLAGGMAAYRKRRLDQADRQYPAPPVRR